VKSIKDRNPSVVGLITLVLLALAVFVAYHAPDLPVIGGGSEYTAQFTESAGLNPSDEVRVAGIRVGKVTDVGLSRGLVVVRFRVSGVRVGDRSRASIEIKTLLGEKFLALRPAGAGEQDPSRPIPVSRTNTPFEIPDAFNQLTHTLNRIDTGQLAQSFRVLAATFATTPEQFRGTLRGLSRLSETIASRDQALTSLLAGASNVSGVLAQRDQQVARLIGDGSTVLGELRRREDAITRLLVGTEHLADQLRGLVADNRVQLHPALDELDRLTKLLRRDQDALAHGVAALAPYTRAYNNVVANGRWFDGYFCGLLSPVINLRGLEFNPGTCAPPKTAGPRPAAFGSQPARGGAPVTPEVPMTFGGGR
jgi:phospholipid/cholesterol/gamma-HCH transport system substrate-binding protein